MQVVIPLWLLIAIAVMVLGAQAWALSAAGRYMRQVGKQNIEEHAELLDQLTRIESQARIDSERLRTLNASLDGLAVLANARLTPPPPPYTQTIFRPPNPPEPVRAASNSTVKPQASTWAEVKDLAKRATPEEE